MPKSRRVGILAFVSENLMGRSKFGLKVYIVEVRYQSPYPNKEIDFMKNTLRPYLTMTGLADGASLGSLVNSVQAQNCLNLK